MKGPLLAAILFLAPLSLLCNCAHLVQKREDYRVSTQEPIVDGARITAEMITTDGKANYSMSAMIYFVADETETGPYKCLFTAWGDAGKHVFMTVEKLTFRTASGQTATAPPSKPLPFAVGAEGKGWQATYPVPGLLGMDYAQDGDVTIEAKVAIRNKRRTIRKTVSFTLSPSESKKVEFATVFDGLRKKE